MKICIVHPLASLESAQMLAAALKADCINPYATNKRKFTDYDLVINYGCNRKLTVNLRGGR